MGSAYMSSKEVMVAPCEVAMRGSSSTLHEEIVADTFEEFVLGNDFISREEVIAHPCERS